MLVSNEPIVPRRKRTKKSKKGTVSAAAQPEVSNALNTSPEPVNGEVVMINTCSNAQMRPDSEMFLASEQINNP